MPVPSMSEEIDNVIEGLSGDTTGGDEPGAAAPDATGDAEAGGEQAPEPYAPDGFSFYDSEGKPITEYGPEVSEFLRAAQINYRALGEDHTKSLQDMVRGASRGHLNTRTQEQAAADNKSLSDQLAKAQAANKDYETQSTNWDAVLKAAQNSDIQPFLDVVQTYIKAQNQPGPSPELTAAQARIAELEGGSRDEQIVDQEIRPYLKEVADNYGIEEQDRQELEDHVMEHIRNIPANQMSAERVGFYLKTALLGELEEAGYQSTGTTTPAALSSADMTELAAFRAAKENDATAAAAAKAGGGAPASGAGGAGGESKGVVPKFDTPQEYMKWLKEG